MLDTVYKAAYGWWRTVDRPTVIALFVLLVVSMLLTATASPPVANRLGLYGYYFAFRHLYYLAAAVMIIIFFSGRNSDFIKRFSIIAFFVCLGLLVLVKFAGYEVKGATRWINVFGISIQPSEFMKPLFAVVSGWLLSLRDENPEILLLTIIIYVLVTGLILIQPDLGMSVVITAIYGIQLFISGLPIIWIIAAAILCGGLLIGAYLFFPHVAARIDSFLDPDYSENFQVSKSIASFERGGVFGVGPGEGVVKQSLPDSHTDFIFAVAGEEFGALACMLIAAIFLFIVVRTFLLLLKQRDQFIIFAAAGLVGQFGIQAFINMGVTLHLLPTKGMTLPFISSGGSSTLAVAMAIGFVLAFTHKQIDIQSFKIQPIADRI